MGLQTLAELLVSLCYSGLPSCCATQRTFSVISNLLHLLMMPPGNGARGQEVEDTPML